LPNYELVTDASGEPTNVTVSYPMDLMKQMLAYSEFTKKARREAEELR